MERETIRDLAGTVVGVSAAFAAGGLAFTIAPVGAVGLLSAGLAKVGIAAISGLVADAAEKSMIVKVNEVFEEVDKVKEGIKELKDF